MKHKISIFIPVFNEERIIERDIKALDYVIKKIPVEYEIFIVNDSSKDRTKIIAKKIEQSNSKVTLLNYEINPTRRENLAQSFKKASGDIIAFVDIDLIASLRFLPELINQIILGYDIATGNCRTPLPRKTTSGVPVAFGTTSPFASNYHEKLRF
ncbi:MAG: glycosyltransferase [Candidatus Omnitrophica bacterium]|nr:glycosyltransferase [Candidatus Omnitrophota bacterium]